MSAPTGQNMYQYDDQPAYGSADVVKPGYDNHNHDGDINKDHHHHGPPPAGGICDLNCDWGTSGETGKAGSCFDIFACEPCCGEPCNFMDGLYCCKFSPASFYKVRVTNFSKRLLPNFL